MNATAPASAEVPPDLTTMRAAAQRMLCPDSGPDALPPATAQLAACVAELRAYIVQLAPAVQQIAERLPATNVTAYGALACVTEARGKLRAPELGLAAPGDGVRYARKLARVLGALCEYHDILGILVTTGETPEQTAARRLGDHCVTCLTCRAVDDEGANAALPCAEHDRLYAAYRQARARLSAARLGER